MFTLSHIFFEVDIIYALELSSRACPPLPFFLMLMIKCDSLQNHIDDLDIE